MRIRRAASGRDGRWLGLLGLAGLMFLAGGAGDGRGGRAGLSDKDIQALRDLRAAVALVATDVGEHINARRQALGALERLDEALHAWGAPNQEQWCLELVQRDPELFEQALRLALAQARGGDHHLGVVRQRYAAMVAAVKEDTEKGNAYKRMFQPWDKLIQRCEKPPRLAPTGALQPLRVTVKGMSLATMLQPLKEK